MASITLNPSQQFPEGTSVGAYPRSAKRAGGAPSGAAITSATVTGGQLVFTGLVLNTSYTAYANVGGVDRYMDFATAQSDISAKRANITGTVVVEATVDLPSIATLSAADVNVTLPAGTCKPGDLIVGVFLPALNAGLHIQGAGVVVADQVRLRAQNTTAGALDAAAVQVTFGIIRVS
jgi:hypothetical protein